MTQLSKTAAVHNFSGGPEAVHLLLTEGEVEMMAVNPEQVMQDIETRATALSSILSGILQEPQGRPDWGLND
jgi:hypothetical protein